MFSFHFNFKILIPISKLNVKKEPKKPKKNMRKILEGLIYKRPMIVCLKFCGIHNCHVMMLKM